MIEDDVFLEMAKGQPRLIAMMKWRLALSELTDTDEVAEAFKEDWNKVNELWGRIAAPPVSNVGGAGNE